MEQLHPTFSQVAHTRRTSSHRRAPRERGFTITELLTVLAVVGILAAAAAPSMVEYLRDRRVDDAARQISDMYRQARSRAMGRGAAVQVEWDESAASPTAAAPGGRFVMAEVVAGAGSPFNTRLPVSSCLGGDTSFVTGFDDRRARYQPSSVRFLDPSGTALTNVTICFTPRGRTFISPSSGAAYVPLTFVARIEVTNTTTSLRRFVILPPNGAARVEARLQ